MIDIAICDDERVIRERITDLINKQGADCHIENFGAGNELLAAEKHFDVAAFHYLLKPIDEKKFAEVFDNAVKEIREQQRPQETEAPTLLIKTKNRSRMLKQREIIFIENRANKVDIHTAKDVIEAYYTMSKLEGELMSSFYRCHRGYLVNMEHITEYSSDMIDMDNGERVYLAKEKYPEFVKEYMRYLGDGGTADV